MAKKWPNVSSRMSLRIRQADLAKLKSAATLQQTTIAKFIVRVAVREAESVIARGERIELTERDMNRVLDLIEHPPAPNARLIAAARNLPKLG
jgi:uncharacterized protein (DUF1778 family)